MMRQRHRLGRVLAAASMVAASAVGVASAGPADAAPRYRCGTVQGGSATKIVHITDVRVGLHRNFDRFVVQFRGSKVPHYMIVPKSSAVFRLDPSDRRVKLLGHAGLRIVFQQTTGIGTFAGPYDLKPRFPELREARRIGDFEAVTTWGLGLNHPSCKRVSVLHHPTRLVVDVHH